MKSTVPFLLFTLLWSVLSACTAVVEADPFPSFDMPSAAAGTSAATEAMPQPDLPATSQPDTGPVTRPMPSPTASDSSSEGLHEMEAAGTGGGAGVTQQAEGGAGRDRDFAMSAGEVGGDDLMDQALNFFSLGGETAAGASAGGFAESQMGGTGTVDQAAGANAGNQTLGGSSLGGVEGQPSGE